MRPELFARILPFDEALRRVMDAARPLTHVEHAPLARAVGRVAATDVVASIDVPPFDRAAMDGYAVRAADIAGATRAAPVSLVCIDQIFTGQFSARALNAGQCAEIGTGAPLPAGADAVVMVERTSRAADTVSVFEAARHGQNVGRRGTDIAAGQLAVRTGDVIGPARAGALAAVGTTSVDIFSRPRVAILSTGHEVAAAGSPLGPAQIYDVNSITLAAIVEQHGGEPNYLAPVADSIDALTEALVSASDHDIIITSGGSSVGGRDLLLDALQQCGRVIFHGIAVKPGKPTLFGAVGTTALFGMPGNPTSCLSNAYILLVPFLRAVARLPLWQPVKRSMPLARGINALADRHQFYTVRVVNDVAEPAFKSSGDITSMAAADGYIEVAAGMSGIDAGDDVLVTMF